MATSVKYSSVKICGVNYKLKRWDPEKCSITIVLVDVLRICVLAMSEVIPFRCTHSDFQRAVFLRLGESFELLELIDVEGFRAFQFALWKWNIRGIETILIHKCVYLQHRHKSHRHGNRVSWMLQHRGHNPKKNIKIWTQRTRIGYSPWAYVQGLRN